ncbi:MAG: CoA-binding protein, partial [Methylophilus sp.]
MRPHYLSPLFSPKSVAVFGASNNVDAIGGIVFKNMLEDGYQGQLYPINPKHQQVQGRQAYSSIAEINEEVELAVITTPAASVPKIIEDCGKHNV